MAESTPPPPTATGKLSDFSSPDGHTPFTWRKHMFLHVPPKRLVNVPLIEPITAWLKHNFGDAPTQALAGVVREMDQSRKVLANFVQPYVMEIPEEVVGDEGTVNLGLFLAAQNTSTGDLVQRLESSYLPSMRRYFTALKSLMTKINTTGENQEELVKIDKLRFEWHYWLGDTVDSKWHSDQLRLELCSTMFNLGAMYSLVACVNPSQAHATTRVLPDGSQVDSVDVLMHRTRYFRYAAFVFSQLEKRLREYRFAVYELDPNVVSIFATIMLAQAQECAYRGHKPVDGCPASPEMHEKLCRMAYCATAYYHEAMHKFVQYQELLRDSNNNNNSSVAHDEEDDAADRRCHIPDDWYWHCDSAYYLMRLVTNLHYAEHLSTDDDAGTKIGFLRKCCRIATKHSAESPSEAEFTKPVQERLQWLQQSEQHLTDQNRRLYNKSIPAPEQIESIAVEPLDKAAIPSDLIPSDETLKCLVVFMDSFDILVSTRSTAAWMQYRLERATRYNKHLVRQTARFQKMMDNWNNNSYMLLLAYVCQHIVSVQPGESPMGFYQTAVGSKIYQLRGKQGPALLRAAVGQLRLTTLVETMSHCNAVESRLANRGSEMVKMHLQIIKEEMEIVSALCNRMRRFETHSNYQLQLITELKTERDVVLKMFGRYAELLFPSIVNPHLPSSTPVIPKPSNLLKEHNIKQILSHCTITQGLLALEFQYETLEDKLAELLVEDFGRPPTELMPAQLSDVTNWVDQQLKWMDEICEQMHAVELDIEKTEKHLQNTVISAEQLYRYCVASVRHKGDSSKAVVETASSSSFHNDAISENMHELAQTIVAVFIHGQTGRELDVAVKTARRVQDDCHALTQQWKLSKS